MSFTYSTPAELRVRERLDEGIASGYLLKMKQSLVPPPLNKGAIIPGPAELASRREPLQYEVPFFRGTEPIFTAIGSQQAQVTNPPENVYSWPGGSSSSGSSSGSDAGTIASSEEFKARIRDLLPAGNPRRASLGAASEAGSDAIGDEDALAARLEALRGNRRTGRRDSAGADIDLANDDFGDGDGDVEMGDDDDDTPSLGRLFGEGIRGRGRRAMPKLAHAPYLTAFERRNMIRAAIQAGNDNPRLAHELRRLARSRA